MLNPSLVLQGSLADFALHAPTCGAGRGAGVLRAAGYLHGVGDLGRTGAWQWPLRAALFAGGLMFVAPGGGLMPLSSLQMTAAALLVSVPAVLLAKWSLRPPAR